MDFILMLTRDDRTIDDAEALVAAALDLGIRHIGFKDMGCPIATMRVLAQRIRDGGATSYFEVVSTTSDAITRSLETSLRRLGVPSVELFLLHNQVVRTTTAAGALGLDEVLRRGGVMDVFDRLRAQGLVGALGFTAHLIGQRRLYAFAAARCLAD